MNKDKWLQKKILSTPKRPGCSAVRLVRTRASCPLSMLLISGWLEKNSQLKMGFSAIVACKETEVPRAERLLK